MKAHTRKKAYRIMCKSYAKDGLINLPDGKWVQRGRAVDNSMTRDYHPQTGKK